MCLIFPHYKYGTLHEFIIEQRMDDDYLLSAHLFSFAQDVAQAMKFLHSQQVIQHFVIAFCLYMSIETKCRNVINIALQRQSASPVEINAVFLLFTSQYFRALHVMFFKDN